MKISILCFCIFIFYTSDAVQASPLKKIGSFCAQALEPPYKWLMKNHEGKTKKFHYGSSLSGKEFEITFGKKRGAGYFGSVYNLSSLKGLALLGELSSEDYIVKTPHSFAIPGINLPLLHTEKAALNEIYNYNHLIDRTSLIESALQKIDPSFDPYWQKGHLPEAPILYAIPTFEAGTLIIKPFLKGHSLKDIAKIYRENNNALPLKMEQALHDIYVLVQAIRASVPSRDIQNGQTEGYSSDIRPPNLIYIDDSHEMKKVGFKENRPGFALFELDQVPNNVPQYISEDIEKGFEEYKQEYISYLLQEK